MSPGGSVLRDRQALLRSHASYGQAGDCDRGPWTDPQLTPLLRPSGPLGPPPTCTTSPVPFRGCAPRRHTEDAVPMRHAEGDRGE